MSNSNFYDVRMLSQALLRYGQHNSDCDWWRGEQELYCECGFGRLKRDIKASLSNNINESYIGEDVSKDGSH